MSRRPIPWSNVGQRSCNDVAYNAPVSIFQLEQMAPHYSCSYVGHRSGCILRHLGLLLLWYSRQSWCSICGIVWHQRWSGKSSDIPLSSATTWSFHVWCMFLVKLCLWLSGGTKWYVISDSLMVSLYAAAISLSNTWHCGLMPQSFILVNALSWLWSSHLLACFSLVPPW